MAEERVALSREENPTRTPRTEVAAIPLVEERLIVDKRPVESDRVRVHVTVEERDETITQELCREDLHIERFPRNEQLTEAPHVRIEGNTTIIPIVEEVLVVEKRLVLVEEVHICRRSVSETKEIPVKIRSERATVERDSAAHAEPGSR